MMLASRSRLRFQFGASLGALGAALFCIGAPASAQTVGSTESDRVPQESGSEATVTENEITVIGTRAAQQSANDRKRNARTATDSIVADDIGSFPDRNVAEAMSRLPGVALGRNEFGEGEGVAVRGNGLDLTRVELDGLGVQSTSALSLGADGGREADLRSLPAELVKSIDVVKGSTADMTEGSLGGTVQIRTRTGLDFDEPYLSIRAGGNRNSLGEKITPDGNVVGAMQLFGGRLGLLASGSYSRIQNTAHGLENTTSNNRHYNRLVDFDNSPEKTFQYNVETIGTDQADTPFARSTSGPGGTAINSRQLLEMSAAAQSKADCLSSFPLITPPATGDSTTQQQTRIQRVAELNTCLNQWNDYTPSLIRHFMNSQEEERYSVDLRADFEITDTLTVWGKYNRSDRLVNAQNRSRNPIGDPLSINPAGRFVFDNGNPARRSVAPGAAGEGYYLFDNEYGFSANGASGSPLGGRGRVFLGDVINVIPESVVVDDAHNVVEFTKTNASVGIDQIANDWNNKSSYVQAGADWQTDRLELNVMAGMTKGTSSRTDWRTSRGFTYGDATLRLGETGFWDVELPEGYDESDPASYAQLQAPICLNAAQRPPNCIAQNAIDPSAANPTGSPAYTVGQLPLVTNNFGVIMRPRAGESSERIGKIDLAYDTEDVIPFITRVKVGAQYRKQSISSWGAGGYTPQTAVGTFGQPGYVPAIVVPTANISGTFRGCQETPGSQGPGGLGCNYGFVPSTDPGNVRSGVDTLTPEQLVALFRDTIEANDTTFFNGFPGAGDLPAAWEGINVERLFSQLGANQFLNLDCLKQCVGSDGQIYDQPVTRSNEITKNVYAMADFNQPLPFLGLRLDGNVGVRGVFREVNSRGALELRTIRLVNPSVPEGATYTLNYTQNVDFSGKVTNWLPSFNLGLWAFDDDVVLRFYGGKTVANLPVSRLSPAGNCTIDERDVLLDEDGDSFGCGGRIGNPALNPFTAWNYNWAAEWYPNRDTLISVAYHLLDVSIGNPRTITVDRFLFEGSDRLDPITGQPLADTSFSVPTYENGPGYKRTGWEIQAKTAFTFLPWFLRYTGADLNYSTLTSDAAEGIRDPNTGDLMRPTNESRYFTNASLWYDDGRLNIRLTHQYRTESFSCITPCGGNSVSNNYPGEGWQNIDVPPTSDGWNPGVPRFTDSTAYVDGKISYNIRENFQVYLEARNLTKEAQVTSTGEYERFANGAPRILQNRYGGRRFLAGVVARFGNRR